MELNLTRVDYTVVGITNSNCLKLLPPNGSDSQQKVIVGDNDGIVQMFSVKKDDIQLHFKTLPGKPISSLMLAGAAGTVNDKIFIAAETEIRGYTKKGKLFLSFDPGLTEPITSMYVLGNDLFLCGKHIYNHYKDCKAVGSYLCGDKIVHIIAYYHQKTKRLISLIACEGRMIRVLEHARVTSSIEVESSPTILFIFYEDEQKFILFGTIDGKIGILDVEESHKFDRWLINDANFTSPISCLDHFDLNGNGRNNLIVGRQDGSIEVYNINMYDNLDANVLIYIKNFNECITAVQCGVVGCSGYSEIVVLTYTGRIFGLTTQSISDLNCNENISTSSFNVNVSQKIAKLKSDLEDLQQKVIKEREKYQSLTQSFFDELSAIPLLDVKDSFVLLTTTSNYLLTIEVATAIDNVLLQSDAHVKLLDVEKNSAVISYSDSNPQEGNFLLATYRCQINTNRLELNLQTIEGQKGVLQVYVTPMIQPKCTRLLQYDIKCLSLHYKIHNFDEPRPFNTMSVKGTFSLAEIHAWIAQSLPEVTERALNSEENILWYKNSLLDSHLKCSYKKGEAEFMSENVSTLSILKQFISEEATKRKNNINISMFIEDESVSYMLKLIEQKLTTGRELLNKKQLTEALKELGITDEETMKTLSSKYRNLLSSENISNQQCDCIYRYYGAISDLYVDYNKCKGRSPKVLGNKIIEIMENSNSLEKLLEFFQINVDSTEIK